MDVPAALRTSEVSWLRSVRIVGAQYRPVELFELAESAEELAIVWRAVMASDPERGAAVGDLSLVPEDRWVVGPGSSDLMTAFTYPSSSRFADERRGAYYAANERSTAIAETTFHRMRLLRASGAGATDILVSVLEASIEARLHDARGPEHVHLRDPDPASYPVTQRLARTLREKGSRGIVYDSARRDGGECVALFDPRAVVGPVRRVAELQYRFRPSRESIEIVEIAMPSSR